MRRRLVRWLALRLGCSPCRIRVRVRLSGTRRRPAFAVVESGGFARWWATGEDVMAEVARAFRVVSAKVSRRIGRRVRLVGPFKVVIR